MINDIVACTFVGIYAYLSIVANYHTHTSDSYSRQQKRLQYCLAWTVPFLGALLIILVALSDREHLRTIMSNSKLPSPLLRIITLSAFSGGVGLSSHDTESSDFGSSSWEGCEGGGDCGGGDGGGGDG